jgi:hypothetical protein
MFNGDWWKHDSITAKVKSVDADWCSSNDL